MYEGRKHGEVHVCLERLDIAPDAAREALEAEGRKALGAAAAASQEVNPRNTLLLVVAQARGLLSQDSGVKGDQSDPYVVVEVGNSRNRITSSVKQDCLEPSWNESYLFPVSDPECKITVRVMNKNMMRDSLLGAAVLPVNSFKPRRGSSVGGDLHEDHIKHWIKLKDKDGVTQDKPRGELLLTGIWKSEPADSVPTTARAATAADGVDTAQGGEVENAPTGKDESKMTDEERAAAEESAAKERDRLMSVEFVDGDYQVQVHIIEARSLKGEDPDGSADPVVYAEVLGQKKNTKCFSNRTSAVWDETLFLNFPNMEKEQMEDAVIKVSVFDADTFTRDDLIGSYSMDASYVYFQPHHEVHNQWVGITDPTNADDTGVQGYLKLSVAVLGPGDKRHQYDAKEEAEMAAKEKSQGVQSMLLMPPQIERQLKFLVLTVHRADHMPAMDSETVLSKAGIDAYVEASFAGNPPIRTKYKTVKGVSGQLAANFDTELWMPVLTPTMTNRIELTLWDYDRLASNDRVGTIYLKFNQIEKHGRSPMWMPVYGAPDGVDFGNVKNHMNRYPESASNFRGRLLISGRVVSDREVIKDEKEEVKIKAATPLPPRLFPPMRRLVLRALVVAGSEIPRFRKHIGVSTGLMSSDVGIEIAMGQYSIFSRRCKNFKGVVHWGSLEQIQVQVPVEAAYMPDTFVYLFRGDHTKGKHVRVSYARFKTAALIEYGFQAEPWWQPLREDAALNALADDENPGNVLIKLGMGTDTSAAENPWETDLEALSDLTPYQLRVHVYQGRSLPAADDNGSIDPFVKVLFNGTEQETSIKTMTTSPSWYETIQLDLMLPPLQFAPQVLLQLWDWDSLSKNDKISELRFDVNDDRCIRGAAADLPPVLPDPEWYKLTTVGREKEGAQGYLLLNFQLITKDDPKQRVPVVPTTIYPDFEEWYAEITVLGLRSLAPYAFLKPQNPYIEFDVGERKHSTEVKKTATSSKPSGEDPNFCERITLPVPVPTNPIFAPSLHLRVHDSRLGGFSRPLLGTATIPLESKIPGSATYMPPTGAAMSENIFEVDPEDAAAESDALLQDGAQAVGLKDLKEDEALLSGGASAAGGAGPDGSGLDDGPGAQPTGLGAPTADPNIATGSLDPTQAVERNRAKVADARARKPSADADRAEDTDGGVGDGKDTSDSSSESDSDSDTSSDGEVDDGGAREVKLPAPAQPIAEASGAAAGEAKEGDEEEVVFEEEDEDDVSSSVPPTAPDGLNFGLLTLDAAQGVEDEKKQKYLKDRRVYDCGLESVFGTAPFETYPIWRGQTFGRGSVMGIALPSSLKKVGYFKGLIRLMREQEDSGDNPHVDLKAILAPRAYSVRVYIMDCFNVQPMDSNGTSDPYLTLSLGKKYISDRKNYLPKTTEPKMYRRFDITTHLPGPSRLELTMWDYDMITFDDMIGKTVIDLEDRVFEKRWSKLGQEFQTDDRLAPKPVEERTLWNPTSTTSQGTMRMWVDIIKSTDALKYPGIDITLPPPQEFEVRVIVWKTRGVRSADTVTDQNDLYIKGWVEGCTEQCTDIHWRCKKGKGSFNWRMKFKTQWPNKFPYLTFQMWDQDLFKWNDCIAESTPLDMSKCLAEAFRTKAPTHMFPPLKAPPKDGEGKGGGQFQGAETLGVTASDPTQAKDGDQGAAPASGAAAGQGGEDGDPSSHGRAVGAPQHRTVTAGAVAPAPQQPTDPQLAAYESDDDEGVIDSVGGVSTSGPKRPAAAGVGDEEEDTGMSAAEAKRAADEAEAKESVKNMKKLVGIEEDVHPDNAAWLKMYTEFKDGKMCREFAGKVLISVQAVPIEIAKDELPAGFGRSEPNMNPELPDPVGRMKFSLNPLYLLNEILGPALCRKIMCLLVFIAIVAILIWGTPFLNVVFVILSEFPTEVQVIIWLLLFIVLCGPPIYYNAKASCQQVELSEDAALDLDPELADPEESKPLLPKEADKAEGKAAPAGGASASGKGPRAGSGAAAS